MNENKELYILLKQLLDVDITFIIDDIVGNFTDPDIPVNVDSHNFSIDVDTPYGVCNITITGASGYYEVIFKRIISETFYEEYYLNLNSYSKNFLVLKGNTIELREKGFVINTIEKRYASEELARCKDDNRQIYEEGKLIVDSIVYVSKFQRVYSNKALFRLYGKKNLKNKKSEQIFSLIRNIKNDLCSMYIHFVIMSLPNVEKLYCSYGHKLDISIGGFHSEFYTQMFPEKNPRKNLVGRAYNLYQGIITQDNYDDAVYLINMDYFNNFFSFEDCNYISNRIEELIGPSALNYRKEYSTKIINDVKSYYMSIKRNYPFFFERFSEEEKKHVLENYIYLKERLLNNPDNR